MLPSSVIWQNNIGSNLIRHGMVLISAWNSVGLFYVLAWTYAVFVKDSFHRVVKMLFHKKNHQQWPPWTISMNNHWPLEHQQWPSCLLLSVCISGGDCYHHTGPLLSTSEEIFKEKRSSSGCSLFGLIPLWTTKYYTGKNNWWMEIHVNVRRTCMSR